MRIGVFFSLVLFSLNILCAKESVWDTTSTVLKYQGNPVVLHGFALTSMQYLLRGIGMQSFATYNWNTPENIFSLDTTQLDAIMQNLPQKSGVMPAVRISINASYYLGVVTPPWSDNNQKYPKLSTQYQTLLDGCITYFTGKNVVVILDLHWNDDVKEQQPMALRSHSLPATTGDSKEFWSQMAQKYGSNDLVWYELYNEPFSIDFSTWLHGDETYWGMADLYAAIRSQTDNPILISGINYAYAQYNNGWSDDGIYQVGFEKNVSPENVLYCFHPYMGPDQSGDQGKSADNFEALVAYMQKNIARPLILTETGQYCCATNGACYLYPGTYQGETMGYLEAVLEIAKKQELSWTLWGWRPNTNGACSGPDANNGNELITPFSSGCPEGQCGADYKSLVKLYY